MISTPSHALAELATQHAGLRAQIAHCEQLADRLDAGLDEPTILLEAIAQLRRAFDVHNQFEEQLLHPLLLDSDWTGAVRVARMVEDHVEEHRAIHREIAASTAPASATSPHATTAALRDTLASLRAHLESEERGFLSKKVLRDDLSRGPR